MTVALSKFFAFFCALVASAAIVYTMYFWIVGSPVGDAWKVVGSLAVSAIILVALTISMAAVARVEGQAGGPASMDGSKTGTDKHSSVA